MKNFTQKFITDTRGNFATIFALASVALVGAVGVAVDYSSMVSMRSDMQAQTDAAVLAIVTHPDFKNNGSRDATKMAEFAFDIMVENGYPATGDQPVIILGDNDSVRVEASSTYATGLTRILGAKEMTVSAGATSLFAGDATVEIVLALDVTGSMGVDGKIEALQDAATTLVNEFEESGSDGIKIGIVPFSNYVNVGVSRRGESWLDAPADQTLTETYEYQPTIQTGFETCTGTEDYIKTWEEDGVTYSRPATRETGCTGENTYENDGPPETRTRTVTDVWHGCVGSRPSGLHMRDASYSTRVPGLINDQCAAELTPLTNDYEVLKTAISAISANEETYLPAGLIWGQRLLSPQIPFTEGNADTPKFLVLMTDGENTLSLDLPFHSGDDANATDMDTASLCTRIKQDDIQIFTIAFKVTDSVTKNMLKKCASKPNQAYRAENNKALEKAFRGIASQILSIRLTQ